MTADVVTVVRRDAMASVLRVARISFEVDARDTFTKEDVAERLLLLERAMEDKTMQTYESPEAIEPDEDFHVWAEQNEGGTWPQYCQAIADGWERRKLELGPVEVVLAEAA